jgi:gliding motility-associated-like protein
VTKAGDYFVTIDKEACYASDTLSVRYLAKPVAALGADTTLCFGQKITLRAKVEQGTYAWSNGSTLDSTIVSQVATYEVTLRNRCGSARDDIRVDYESCREAFIPNAFSPNGDQQNEVWSIQSGGDVKLVHRLEIYNRWGSRVFQALNFQANDLNSAWTGEGFPEGVYLYFAKIEYRDGGVEIKKGSLSLLR